MNCPSCGGAMQKRAPGAGFWDYSGATFFCPPCRESFFAGRVAKVRHIGWPPAPLVEPDEAVTVDPPNRIGRHGVPWPTR